MPPVEGLVLWAVGNRARVLVDNERALVNIPGRWRLGARGRALAPGDRLMLRRGTHGWRPEPPLPRKSEFTRRASGPKSVPQVIAVNLDLAVVVASVDQPETPFGLVDRLLVTAALGGVPAMLVVNKVDLVPPERLDRWRTNYQGAVDEIIFTSALTGYGILELAKIIVGLVTLLAGSSGVGKSLLANRIDPSLNLKIGEISRATGKGRHITSATELHRLEQGGWLADTPGLRECAPWGMTQDRLASTFREIEELAPGCHFRDCLHRGEAGCVVQAVAGTPELPLKRYRSYLKLLSEAESP